MDLASYSVVHGQSKKTLALMESVLRYPESRRKGMLFRIHAIKGMAYLRTGELQRSYEEFSHSLDEASKFPHPAAEATIRCNVADVLFWQGKLKSSFEQCELALEKSIAGESYMPAAGFAFIIKARVLYEWNRIEEADTALHEGMDIISESGINEAFGLSRITQARIEAAKGGFEEAEEVIRQAASLIGQCGIERLKETVEGFHAGLQLKKGEPAEARNWAGRYARTRPVEYIRDAEDLTFARVRLEEHKFEESLHVLSKLEKEAGDTGRFCTLVEAMVLKALTLFAMGTKKEAFSLISKALEQAGEEGFVRIFLDEGDRLYQLIRQAKSQRGIPEYGNAIITSFEKELAVSAMQGRAEVPSFLQLTPREMEVLALLANRLSNEEIGTQLYISLPTVKTHIRHIFDKLDVESRHEAAVRARNLGIIE